MKKIILPLVFFLATSIFPLACSKEKPLSEPHPLKGKQGFSKIFTLEGRTAEYSITNNLNELLEVYDGKNPIRSLNCVRITNSDQNLEDIENIYINTNDGRFINESIIRHKSGLDYNKNIFPDKTVVDEMIKDSNKYMKVARTIVKEDVRNYEDSIVISKNPLR